MTTFHETKARFNDDQKSNRKGIALLTANKMLKYERNLLVKELS